MRILHQRVRLGSLLGGPREVRATRRFDADSPQCKWAEERIKPKPNAGIALKDCARYRSRACLEIEVAQPDQVEHGSTG